MVEQEIYIMDVQQIWSNCVMLLRQYGVKCLRNVYSNLLNWSHEK